MQKDMGRFERFDFKIPAQVQVAISGADVLQLVTKNVSAGGVFFPTGNPFSEGLHVVVELLLGRRWESGKKAHVRVEGDVLRSVPGGMAIRFREGYSITAVA